MSQCISVADCSYKDSSSVLESYFSRISELLDPRLEYSNHHVQRTDAISHWSEDG